MIVNVVMKPLMKKDSTFDQTNSRVVAFDPIEIRCHSVTAESNPSNPGHERPLVVAIGSLENSNGLAKNAKPANGWPEGRKLPIGVAEVMVEGGA